MAPYRKAAPSLGAVLSLGAALRVRRRTQGTAGRSAAAWARASGRRNKAWLAKRGMGPERPKRAVREGLVHPQACMRARVPARRLSGPMLAPGGGPMGGVPADPGRGPEVVPATC